jgi:hypothetical protein
MQEGFQLHNKLNFDKTNTTKLIQWTKQSILIKNGTTFFFICVNTPTLNTVKHIIAITTHWNELGFQLFNIQTPKCDHGSEHRMKNVFSCPLHTHLFQKNKKWNLFPTLNNI